VPPDTSVATTVRPVPKTPMVKRTFYIQAETWEAAKALAAEDPRPGGANISDIVRELVEGYVKRGGRR
jgi:hypothetical protein